MDDRVLAVWQHDRGQHAGEQHDGGQHDGGQHDGGLPDFDSILPDGCRDLILVTPVSGPPKLIRSDLASGPTRPIVRQPAQMTGYRLCPGATVDTDRLAQMLGGTEFEPENVEAALTEVLSRTDAVASALSALSSNVASVDAAAHLDGVSRRSLQRLLSDAGEPPPRFWMQLARARRAGRALLGATPFAELAVTYGYADQSHFTREMRRWFGQSPGALRKCPDFALQISAAGLGAQS